MIYRSNCIVFAIKKLIAHGGYIAIRKSRLGSWIPHFIWVKDLKDAEIEHFVPVDAIRRKIPPPWFKGYVKKDDKKMSCECNCGYTCGGPGKCHLFKEDVMKCINEHWKKDCKHDFTGKTVQVSEFAWSQKCSLCGMSAIDHDCRVGP